jgi:probable rRNA maturation factor
MKPVLHIALSVDDRRWRAVAGVASLTRRAARAALARQASGLRSAELGLVLASDARLRALNRRWRGVDKPTNVLAFPAHDGVGAGSKGAPPRQLGDVIVAYQTVVAEARAQGKPVAAHLSHLIVHGVLHLLGFDHRRAAEAADMEAAEIAILAGLGLPDPYQIARPTPGPRAARRAARRPKRAARALSRAA